MTCIVHYPTKKALKLAVTERPQAVTIEDPSIYAPFYGRLTDYMAERDRCVVTNHPKRTWFAMISQGRDGKLKVN